MSEAEDIARRAWEARGFIMSYGHLGPDSQATLVAVAQMALDSMTPAPPSEPERRTFPDYPEFMFYRGPWENSDLPTIVRRDPEGGDPHILCVIKRIHHPEALQDIIDRANACQEDDLQAFLAERA